MKSVRSQRRGPVAALSFRSRLAGLATVGLIWLGGCGQEPSGSVVGVDVQEDTLLVIGRLDTTSDHEVYSGLVGSKLIPGIGVAYTTRERRLIVVDWAGRLVLDHDGQREGPGHFLSPPSLDSFGDTIAAYELSGRIHLFLDGRFLRTEYLRPVPLEGFRFTVASLLSVNEMAFSLRERSTRARQRLMVFGPTDSKVIGRSFSAIDLAPDLISPAGRQPVAVHNARGGLMLEWTQGGDTLWSYPDGPSSAAVPIAASFIVDARPSSGATVWIRDRVGADGPNISLEYSGSGEPTGRATEGYPWDSLGDTILERRSLYPDYPDFRSLVVRVVRSEGEN